MWAIAVNNEIHKKGNRDKISLVFDITTMTEESFKAKYGVDDITYMSLYNDMRMQVPKNCTVSKFSITTTKILKDER